jgi:transposase InsO family protein
MESFITASLRINFSRLVQTWQVQTALFRFIEVEEGYLRDHPDEVDDYMIVLFDWVADYNQYWPHEPLGNLPPTAFMPWVFNAEISTSELST